MPFADLTEAEGIVDANVLEAHPGVRHAPHAHGRLLVGRVDPRRAGRDQEGGEPGRQRSLRVGDAVGEDEVGLGAAADVLLEAVDHPGVAVADGPGLDAPDVGAGGRLADGQGGRDLGGAQRPQKPVDLLRRAELLERLGHEVAVDRPVGGQRRDHAAHLLGDDHADGEPLALAAVFLGHQRGQIALLGHQRKEVLAAELGVALVAQVLEVGPGELADLGPQRPLLRRLERLEPGVRFGGRGVDLLHARDPNLTERSLTIRLSAHSRGAGRLVESPVTGRRTWRR
jgi:hypothetical protein